MRGGNKKLKRTRKRIKKEGQGKRRKDTALPECSMFPLGIRKKKKGWDGKKLGQGNYGGQEKTPGEKAGKTGGRGGNAVGPRDQKGNGYGTKETVLPQNRGITNGEKNPSKNQKAGKPFPSGTRRQGRDQGHGVRRGTQPKTKEKIKNSTAT